MQKNVIYIPKSVKRERMIENGEVFSFTIEDEDMTKLDTLTTPEALQVSLYLRYR